MRLPLVPYEDYTLEVALSQGEALQKLDEALWQNSGWNAQQLDEVSSLLRRRMGYRNPYRPAAEVSVFSNPAGLQSGQACASCNPGSG